MVPEPRPRSRVGGPRAPEHLLTTSLPRRVGLPSLARQANRSRRAELRMSEALSHSVRAKECRAWSRSHGDGWRPCEDLAIPAQLTVPDPQRVYRGRPCPTHRLQYSSVHTLSGRRSAEHGPGATAMDGGREDAARRGDRPWLQRTCPNARRRPRSRVGGPRAPEHLLTTSLPRRVLERIRPDESRAVASP
jgi:hypothetical protein